MNTIHRNWEAAWQAGKTGWVAGASPPALRALIEAGQLPEGRALVPGCGAGYDVLELAGRPGGAALGLELAPTARERFLALRQAYGIAADRADVQIIDAFAFEPDAPFEVIFDYTFLCAIPRELHKAWALKMRSWLARDGVLVTLIFPVRHSSLSSTLSDAEGPPYAMHPELVRGLLDPSFEALSLKPAARSHAGREGKEWLGLWKHR